MTKPARVTRYRKIAMPGHPLAQTDGQVYVHRMVLFDKIGPGQHQCHWCQRDLSWDVRGAARLMADHLDGDRWNNTAENLAPTCRRCNSYRATRPDFLTHCENGHEWKPETTTYIRPDGKGRQCRPCSKEREHARHQRRYVPRSSLSEISLRAMPGPVRQRRQSPVQVPRLPVGGTGEDVPR